MPSAWTQHLAAYRASHPSKTMKECMIEASACYRKAGATYNATRRRLGNCNFRASESEQNNMQPRQVFRSSSPNISIVVEGKRVHATDAFHMWRRKHEIKVGKMIVPDEEVGQQLFIYHALAQPSRLWSEIDENGQEWKSYMYRADKWLYNTEPVSIIRNAIPDIGFVIKGISGEATAFFWNGDLDGYRNLEHPVFYNMAARVCKEQTDEVPTMIVHKEDWKKLKKKAKHLNSVVVADVTNDVIQAAVVHDYDPKNKNWVAVWKLPVSFMIFDIPEIMKDAPPPKRRR